MTLLRRLQLPQLPTLNATQHHDSDTQWLALTTVSYTPEHFIHPLTYELVQRKQKGLQGISTQHGKVDAVDIIAITTSIVSPDLHNNIILVVQYRPPINAFAVEFPSGCIDEDDLTVQDAALRELLEETGYMGEPKNVHDKTAYDASITNSCGVSIEIEVNLDRPVNQSPTQNLDESEWSLKVAMTPISSLYNDLRAFTKSHPHIIIDSRVAAFALGLKMRDAMLAS